jgi:hypothetical protein
VRESSIPIFLCRLITFSKDHIEAILTTTRCHKHTLQLISLMLSLLELPLENLNLLQESTLSICKFGIQSGHPTPHV